MHPGTQRRYLRIVTKVGTRIVWSIRVTFESEAEFGQAVIPVLRKLGFETWQEVYIGTGPGDPCIDVVAQLGQIYFAFELKLHLNDGVLLQAMRNIPYVDYSYVLVPYDPRRNVSGVKQFFIKTQGIGVYFVHPTKLLANIEGLLKCSDITIASLRDALHTGAPRGLTGYWMENPARRISRKRDKKGRKKTLIKKYLSIEQKESVAGVSTGGRSTAFKRSCARIAEYVEHYPQATKKDIWKALEGQLHWGSYNSMCASFRQFGSSVECMKKIYAKLDIPLLRK